jgi:hypothetical protein
MSNSSESSLPTTNENSPGLSAEALAEREILAMMSSSPPLNGIRGNNLEEVDESSLDTDTPSTPTTISLTTPATLRNRLAIARRKAAQLKLHPYQRDSVDEFVNVIYCSDYL